MTHRHYAIFSATSRQILAESDVCAIILFFPPEKATNTMEIRVFRQEDFEEVITLWE
ncbi:acetyltransferase GCN5, partial [Salmonella enterica subsp. enterica serovar Dublin]